MSKQSESELVISRDMARWLLLGLGVIALIVLLIALIVTPEGVWTTTHYVALVVTVAGLLGFILIDPESLAKSLFGRTAQHAGLALLITIAFLALVITGYYVLYRFSREGRIEPWDLSEAQRYSLSDQTIEILEGLEEPVKVTGFYSARDTQSRDEAELFLQKYAGYSDGKFTYEFVDPDSDPGEATRLGGRSGVLIFEQGERTAEASFADESQLTGALVRVTLGEPQQAYVLTGHGERSTDDFTETGFSEAASALERGNYTVAPLDLREAGAIPEDADLLIIPGPTTQFAAQEIQLLSDYLNNGGSLFVTLDPGTGGGSLGLGVLGVEFSPDGSLLASAGADGTARIWDVESGEEQMVLRGHSAQVLDIVFSPDGSRVVTTGGDRTVKVWDVEDGSELATLAGQTDSVLRVAYSPDGQYIASVGQDQVLNVWNADTFEPLPYSPIVTVVPLISVEFSPDSSLIAAGGGRQNPPSGMVFVWNAETGEAQVENALHTNLVLDVAFAPDGDTLYSVAVDGTVGTLDVESGDGTTETMFPNEGIIAIDVSEDGTLFLGLGDGTVHVRGEGDEVVLSGHTNQIWDVAVAPDGEEVASASSDGDIRIWNLADEDTRERITGHATADPLMQYLAEQWGIQVNDDVVIDLWTSQEFDALTPIVTSYDSTSPVTKPLADEQSPVVFIEARSVDAGAPPAEVIVTPLAFTTPTAGQNLMSWSERNLTAQPQFDAAEDVPGPISVAASAENQVTGGKIVVVGDTDFISNQVITSTTYGNSSLLTNAAHWLSDADAGIEIPPPDFGGATWDEPLSPLALRVVQISFSCLLPLALIAIGAIMWFIRRRRR